jgi:hypothetical protein
MNTNINNIININSKMNILKTLLKKIIDINSLPDIPLQINKTKYIINIDSIKLFKKNSVGDGKEKNDLNNKLRENIIKRVINSNIPEDYYTYSLDWFNLKKSINYFINKIIDDEICKYGKYEKIECKIKAGRNYNYDFDVIYNFSNNTEIIKHVEFKCGASKISECPQFISLSSKFNTNYAEYFYDNYIDQISKLYETDINISREDYIKSVFQTSYKKHKWFQYIYENEEKYIEEKKTIVNKSINDYLILIKDSIDLDKISSKLLETQSQKIYMCYDPIKFKIDVDSICDNELSITNIKELKKNKNGLFNTIVCSTKSNTTINMLLRWRNHAGILNPAWQISIKR